MLWCNDGIQLCYSFGHSSRPHQFAQYQLPRYCLASLTGTKGANIGRENGEPPCLNVKRNWTFWQNHWLWMWLCPWFPKLFKVRFWSEKVEKQTKTMGFSSFLFEYSTIYWEDRGLAWLGGRYGQDTGHWLALLCYPYALLYLYEVCQPFASKAKRVLCHLSIIGWWFR